MASNGMDTTNLTSVIVAVALVGAFFGAAGLVLEVGVGESWTVISDPNNATAESNATFSADNATIAPSTIDRVFLGFAWLTLLGPLGIGAIAAGQGNPKAVNLAIRVTPYALMAIGLLEFSDQVSDVVAGGYDWDAHGTGANFVTLLSVSGVIAGIGQALGIKPKA